MESRMTDDEFRQLCMRTFADHDAWMAKMDRQYDKLVQIQLDLAMRHDDHQDRMAALERLQQSQYETLAQMQITLDAIKDILRERRN